MTARVPGARLGLVVGALFALLGVAPPLQGQVPDLALACQGGTGPVSVECTELALTLQAAQAGVGLSASQGNPFTGGASTLGRRFGATPRVALSGRVGLTRFPIPDVDAPGDARALTPTLHGNLTVGVFDGFRLAPTVGGLFSVDLLAGASAAFVPESRGFDGAATSWSYGVRIGVIRESFTRPGVTISATQSRTGSLSFAPAQGLGPEGSLDVVTTSLRGVVGKELLGSGVLLGLGWDRYSSEGEYQERIPNPDPAALYVSRAFGDFTSDRVLLFGGLSRTILVVQFSGEVGWAQGFDAVTPAVQGFDPTAGSLFGVLSLRLTI